MKHNCPYLENKKFCSHKGLETHNNIGTRKVCGYHRCELCPLLMESPTILKNSLESLKMTKRETKAYYGTRRKDYGNV